MLRGEPDREPRLLVDRAPIGDTAAVLVDLPLDDARVGAAEPELHDLRVGVSEQPVVVVLGHRPPGLCEELAEDVAEHPLIVRERAVEVEEHRRHGPRSLGSRGRGTGTDRRADLAGERPVPRGAHRRHHEPQLQGRARDRRAGRAAHRRQGHGAPRDRPERGARGDARGGGARARARRDQVRRAAGLPRDPLRRGRTDRRGRGAEARPPARDRDGAPPLPRERPDRRAVRLVPRRRGLLRHRGRARRRAAGRLRRREGDRRPNRDCARRATPGALPQRPAERELHLRRRPALDRRLGVRGHGRPLLRPRELLRQPRAHRRREQRVAPGRTSARSTTRTSARSC